MLTSGLMKKFLLKIRKWQEFEIYVKKPIHDNRKLRNIKTGRMIPTQYLMKNQPTTKIFYLKSFK